MKIARLVILSLLIPVLAAATTLAPVTNTATEIHAGFHHTWTYYSDATKTQMVGQRYKQDCDGFESLWGTITAYFDYTKVPCDHESLQASTEHSAPHAPERITYSPSSSPSSKTRNPRLSIAFRADPSLSSTGFEWFM